MLSVKHILSARDLTKKDVELILQTARSLKEISYRPIKKVPTLRGKQVLLCFFEDSTRTRLSFDRSDLGSGRSIYVFVSGKPVSFPSSSGLQKVK